MFHSKGLLFYFKKYYPLFLFALTAALTTHSAHAMMSPDEEDVEIVLSSKDEIINHALGKIALYWGNSSSSHIHFNEAAFKLLLPSLYAVLYAQRQNHKPRDIEAILKNSDSDNGTSYNNATFLEMQELWSEKCGENSKELFDLNVLIDLNKKIRSCQSDIELTDQIHCIFNPSVKTTDGVYRFIASIFWIYKSCDAWMDDFQEADMEDTAEYNIKKDKNNIVSKAQTVFKAVLDQLDDDLHSSGFHVLTAHDGSLPVLTLAQALAIIDPKPSLVFTGLSPQNKTDGKPTNASKLTNKMRDLISKLTSTYSLSWPKKPFFLNSYIIHLLKQAEEKNNESTRESCIKAIITIKEKYVLNDEKLMTEMMIYNYPDTLWNDKIKDLTPRIIEIKIKPLYAIYKKILKKTRDQLLAEETSDNLLDENRCKIFQANSLIKWKNTANPADTANANRESFTHFFDRLSDNKIHPKKVFSKDHTEFLKGQYLSCSTSLTDSLGSFYSNFLVRATNVRLEMILRSLAACPCQHCNSRFDVIMDALNCIPADTQAKAQ